jgi:predicted phosphodiesterase
MKVLIIADIHGRNEWKKHVKKLDYDLVVFLGDYVDSYIKTNVEIFNNLKEIIKFKKENVDKVITLTGNHDNQYMLAHPNDWNNPYGCSGYRPEMHFDLYDLFNNNKDLFQACYQIDNNIFSHAGITQDWFDNRFHGLTHKPIDEQINEAFKRKYEPLFDVGIRRGGGHPTGGIFWADKYDLTNDPLKDYNQIIGHTVGQNIEYIGNLLFCDTGDKMEPYILEL